MKTTKTQITNEKEILSYFKFLSKRKSKRILQTGPAVLYNTEDKYPIMEIKCSILAGGTDDKPGIMHFLEHILCNDDKSENNATEFENTNSLEYSAFTSDFYTNYSYTSNGLYLGGVDNLVFDKAINNIETALNCFFKYFKLMRKSIYYDLSKEEEQVLLDRVEKHRKIILSEMETTSDLSFEKCNLDMLKSILTEDGFNVYNKNKRVIGDKESIKYYTLKDLQNAFRKYYTKNRMRIDIILPFKHILSYEEHRFVNLIENTISDITSCEPGSEPIFKTYDKSFYKDDSNIEAISCDREDLQALILSYKDEVYVDLVENEFKLPYYLKLLIANAVNDKILNGIVDRLRKLGLTYYGYYYTGLIESANTSSNRILIIHTEEHETIMKELNDIVNDLKCDISDFSKFLLKCDLRSMSYNVPDLIVYSDNISSYNRYDILRSNLVSFKSSTKTEKEYLMYEIHKYISKDNTPTIDIYINEVFERAKKAILNAKPVFVKLNK